METLYNKDCIDGMKDLDDESIDLIVTSPPYNLDIQYNEYSDNLSRESYLEWIYKVFEQVKRIMKPEGHLFLNMGYSNKDPWIGMDVANEVRKLLVLQNNIMWAKSIAIDGVQQGHYKPINSDRFSNPIWEHLFHFTKTGNVKCNKLAIGVPYVDKGNVDKTTRIRNRLVKKMGFANNKDFDANCDESQRQQVDDLMEIKKSSIVKSDVHCRGNIWYVPYETIRNKKEKGNHPAIFPLTLVENCIKFANVTEGTVLDPFLGTGTTGLSAKKMGLDFIGYDIDEEYVKIAQKRIDDYTDL